MTLFLVFTDIFSGNENRKSRPCSHQISGHAPGFMLWIEPNRLSQYAINLVRLGESQASWASR